MSKNRIDVSTVLPIADRQRYATRIVDDFGMPKL